MKQNNAILVYILLCLVAIGIIGGMCFIGIPAKAEASEELFFLCLGFIVPAAFIIWGNSESRNTHETRSQDNGELRSEKQ